MFKVVNLAKFFYHILYNIEILYFKNSITSPFPFLKYDFCHINWDIKKIVTLLSGMIQN